MRGPACRLLLAGSAIAWAGALGAAETVTYRYDPLGRLVRVERSGGPNSGAGTSYGYDCAGNRLEVGTGAPPAPPPPCPAPPAPPPPPPLAFAPPLQPRPVAASGFDSALTCGSLIVADAGACG